MRLGLLLIALSGCDPADWLEEDEEEMRSAIPAPTVQGVTYTAFTSRAPVPPPGRSTPDLEGPDLWAGDAWVVEGACQGDLEARAHLAEALASGWGWVEDLWGCDAPGFCAWLDEEAGLRPDAALYLRSAGLGCADALQRIAQPDSPDRLVARWFARRAWDGHPEDHPRMREACERIVRFDEDTYWVANAVEALAAVPDGERRLVVLAGEVEEDWRREEIARHLSRALTPEARALYQRSCRAASEEADLCEAPVADPRSDPDAVVQDDRFRPDVLLTAFPDHRRPLLDAMERCARAALDGVVAQGRGEACLSVLAVEEPSRARALAASRERETWPWMMGSLLEALSRYEGPEALRAELIGWGLLDEDAAEPGGVTAVEILAAHGRAVRVDLRGPGADERMLRRLMAAAGVTDVPVRVLPPGAPGGWRTQLAWVDGTRLRALSRDYGRQGDNEQVVGFANAVLEARGDARRFAFVDEWPGYAALGPPEALQTLRDEGLIAVWMPEGLVGGPW